MIPDLIYTTCTLVMGYKGVPILAIYKPFNLVTGMVVDYMHCILLGVTKRLTESWIQKKNWEGITIFEIRYTITLEFLNLFLITVITVCND